MNGVVGISSVDVRCKLTSIESRPAKLEIRPFISCPVLLSEAKEVLMLKPEAVSRLHKSTGLPQGIYGIEGGTSLLAGADLVYAVF